MAMYYGTVQLLMMKTFDIASVPPVQIHDVNGDFIIRLLGRTHRKSRSIYLSGNMTF